LDRERRISLVERVQNSSQWDFDFVALICLSTLIAGLGLLQDSTAVVIGAMLVAPLMTALVGAGLSLIQGNRRLIRNAACSVVLGFLLSFAIGLFLGLMARYFTDVTEHLPDEMKSRGSPGVLDLVIAFASGVAAAYAMGRPNLVSALPGVAIAAALVPPIATSFWHRHLTRALAAGMGGARSVPNQHRGDRAGSRTQPMGRGTPVPTRTWPHRILDLVSRRAAGPDAPAAGTLRVDWRQALTMSTRPANDPESPENAAGRFPQVHGPRTNPSHRWPLRADLFYGEEWPSSHDCRVLVGRRQGWR